MRQQGVGQQQHRHHGEGDLGEKDHPAPVAGVRQRAAEEGEGEHRHKLDEADEAERERRVGELEDLEGDRDLGELRAEEGDQLADEEQPEVATPEGPGVDRRQAQEPAQDR